jgi:hypothetical protein
MIGNKAGAVRAMARAAAAEGNEGPLKALSPESCTCIASFETIGSLIVVPAYEWLHVVRREETGERGGPVVGESQGYQSCERG